MVGPYNRDRPAVGHGIAQATTPSTRRTRTPSWRTPRTYPPCAIPWCLLAALAGGNCVCALLAALAGGNCVCALLAALAGGNCVCALLAALAGGKCVEADRYFSDAPDSM